MKFIKLKGGTAGVDLRIVPDQIVSLQPDIIWMGDKILTMITTLDGKVHSVQESIEEIIKITDPF